MGFIFAFILSLTRHFRLILRLVKREVVGRYRGSFLGLFWSIATPILMLLIYTFVFSYVFKTRWGVDNSNPYEFALQLFAGLIVFNLFSECLSRAPTLIIQHVNYVKKVVFPLEILPWVVMGSALFHTLANLLVLMGFMLLLHHSFSPTLFWLPVILLPIILLTMGLAWLFASLGVFIRDIHQMINMLLTALMFMSPIFYPLSALPDSISRYLLLNPLTLIVHQLRAVLLEGKAPDFIALGCYTGVALLVLWTGWLWFDKTRKGFADVL